ncbi:hypothetical protein NPIL_401501 [Nephila pilipes]|uniref:Uncharacterized protein n=1 Tax=Nephila pilipes TaxID=299642 RepID=A0A8X6PUE0_NEPPI|nr:hypothetical protein NPIL_401501 [Nephila pilipes]
MEKRETQYLPSQKVCVKFKAGLRCHDVGMHYGNVVNIHCYKILTQVSLHLKGTAYRRGILSPRNQPPRTARAQIAVRGMYTCQALLNNLVESLHA